MNDHRRWLEQRIRAWGISPGKKIVIYDQGGTFLATSLFFDLYYHGVAINDLFVLDGGLAKWQATGGAVTKVPTAAARGTPPDQQLQALQGLERRMDRLEH